MAVKIADAFIRLYTEDRDLNKGLADAESKTKGFAGRINKIAEGIYQGIGQAITSGFINLAQNALSEIKDGIGKASDLNETISKTKATFGSSADAALKWSETTSSSLGLSQRAALDATSSLGNMFIQLGAGRQTAFELSKQMIGLSADISSYHNVAGGAEEVTEAMQSAFRGEYDALQRYIPTINAAAVEQKALAMTGKDNVKTLTLLEKAFAVQELIMTGAGAALGDFNKTSREAANSSRILAEKMEEGAASLGSSFLPAVAAIQNLLIGLAPKMFGYAKNITDQLANGLAAGITALLPVIFTIRQLFEYWFAPGSPPKVLPDIDKWGAAAMGQFLKGFSSVDVKSAFAGIGSAIEGILRSDVSAGKADEFGLVGRIFGTRDAIVKAVAEFAKAGSVSESTINKIARSAGSAGPSIGVLVKAYFDVQKASTAATRAQENLNRVTEKYDDILSPLQGKLDGVRAEQQKLANQQRLIDARNTLNNGEATIAEKRAAQLEIEQIALEDQISTVEQQKRVETDAAQAQLDGASKAEEAAQKQLDIAQATIDQQVETNNLLGEQIRLVDQLAATQEAAAKKAESEAEAAANKSKAEAEKAQRALEQIADAQLRYRMQVADTAGDIAIVEEELSKLTPGTAEYYNKLTELDALHKQYNAELEAAAKKTAALGGIDIGPGIDTGVVAPLEKAGEGMDKLAAAIEKAGTPLGPVSENIQKLGDSITSLVTTFGTLFGIDFSAWIASNEAATNANGWDGYGISVKSNAEIAQKKADEVAAALQKSADETNLTLQQMQSNYKVVMDIINGDWDQFWIDWNENQRLGQESSKNANIKSLGEIYAELGDWIGRVQQKWKAYYDDHASKFGDWMGSVQKGWKEGFDKITSNIGQWFTDLGKKFARGGASLIESLIGGMNLPSLPSWMQKGLEGLTNQLPGSEPKDPNSPLRGLKDRGMALVDNFQSGIDAASFNINPLATSLLTPQAAGASSYSTTNGDTIINLGGITINGNANEKDVRSAARNGLLDALRSVGA